MRSRPIGGRDALLQTVRRCIARCVAHSGAAALARSRCKGRLRILMYHGILPEMIGPASFGDLFITVRDFERQMRHLVSYFAVLSLEEVVDTLKRGRVFPERAVLVTLDDGYRSTITSALPVLQEFALPATVFVVPELTGKGPLWFDVLRVLVLECIEKRRRLALGSGLSIDGHVRMDAERAFLELVTKVVGLPSEEQRLAVGQIVDAGSDEHFAERYQEFALAGWDAWRGAVRSGVLTVGAHGLRHEDLLGVGVEERIRDLGAAKRWIERELGRPCLALAYPYGRFNRVVTEAAKLVGFECALTTEDGLNAANDDRFALRRTMIGDKGDFHIFCARVAGAWKGMSVRRPG